MARKVPIVTLPPLLWRSQCGQYTVSIHRKAFRAMVAMALAHYPREVGTSLVGRYSEDGFRADVLCLAPLTSDSVGTRSRFIRGVKGLQQFYARLVSRFRGQRYYVGEWHSHPDEPPQPSRIDTSNQSAIAKDTNANCPEAIIVIVGGDFVNKPELRIDVYSRKKGRVQLSPVIPAIESS